MDDLEQARAYSEADFDEPHRAFVDEFQKRFGELADRRFRAVDLGCGPADVTTRFALAHPAARVIGVDGSAPMLAFGRERIVEAGLEDRVELLAHRLPDEDLAATTFDVTLSNSLLHHLPDPQVLWHTAAGCTAIGGAVFVMDLCRPTAEAEVTRLVHAYAADAPAVLQRDFAASLRAAYRPDEVREQVTAAGLSLTVEQPTDRHLLVWGSR
jgi:SAM-dependent methyltransferase